MKDYRLSDILNISLIQRLADSNFNASGVPMSIVDAQDQSILVRAGWTDICLDFHRANPLSRMRCRESDESVKDRLADGDSYQYKCKNGLWHVAFPIIVAGRHLATMFLAQFYFQGEVPDREYFVRQAREFGYDLESYLAALDRLRIFSVERVNYIVEYNKALVRFIADLAEQSLREVKLYELSLSDELTGLYNRRGFFTLADQQLKVARRIKKPMLLIYADLNGFKEINDTHGHALGDEALREFSAILKKTFRESDLLARVGGDEFVILITAFRAGKADAYLKRLYRNIEQFNDNTHPYRLSISTGVVGYDPSSPCTLEEILMDADRRMYEEKTASKKVRVQPY